MIISCSGVDPAWARPALAFHSGGAKNQKAAAAVMTRINIPRITGQRRGDREDGDGDHAGEALAIATELAIPIAGIHEIAEWLGQTEGVATIGFGKGGTIDLAGAKVTMVNAVHSSSFDFQGGRPLYAGSPAGFMIAGEGHVIYVSGDTDVMADMKVFNDLHHPDIGILCSGGRYTMDMTRAAYAARTFFEFKTVIPCHYRTFPILEQSAAKLIEGLPGVKVIEPQVMEPITF